MSAETVAKQLAKARRSGNGWVACCPAHDDENASLSLTDGTDGKVLAKCHAGCTFGAIAAALLKRGISLNSKEPRNSRGKLIATYDYKAEDGKLLFQSCRFDPKRFTQRQPDGKGGWQWNLRGVKPVPYRLPELKVAIAAGKRVFIVEGEKDGDNLVKLGFVATCNAGGAGKWPTELVPPFKGANIIIIPDNDKPGHNHCRVVGEALKDVAASIHVLELPDLPEKGDVSDWIAAGGTADQLRALKTLPFVEWLAAQPVHVETDDERLARLTALSPLEYDRIRKAEAAAAGVQPRVLDAAVKQKRGQKAADDTDEPADFLVDPEPWGEPVDGADLLDRIVEVVNAHMILPRGAAESVALWVLHAHAHDCFFISPVLGITSPTPECGKSTLLTIVGAMVPRALTASNITTSGVFRAVDKWRPTLLIDEADTFIGVNDEIRGVLNSGHQKVSAYVIRTVDTGGAHEPRLYRTWAPKVIAMIGKMPSTLTSRSIRIELQKKQPGANVKPLRADRLDHLKPLLQQAARWVADNKIKLGATDPDMPAGIGNRTADNWRPLIAIADVAGGDWPERARRIAVGDKTPMQEIGILLLHDIQKIFETERVTKIASQELANKLVGAGDEIWVEFRHGKQITQRQIAELLEPFRITPKNIRFGTVVQRGYQLEQFKEAFSSYTPEFAATALQASETAENDPKSSATADSHVADKNDEKTSNSVGCSVVAAKTPPAEEPEQKTPSQAAKGNGHHACAHCGKAGEIGDQLVSALIPGRNQHGWLHRRCRRDLTLQNKQGQPS